MAKDEQRVGEDEARVWQLMKDVDICMFVTLGNKGVSARPMSAIVDPKRHTVAFLCNDGGQAVADLSANPHALLAFYGGPSQAASVKGQAQITRDRAVIKSLWNTGAQAFWPEGPEHSAVVAITVSPAEAEYWIGSNSLVLTATFLFALATNSSADMGDNRVVDLSPSGIRGQTGRN